MNSRFKVIIFATVAAAEAPLSGCFNADLNWKSSLLSNEASKLQQADVSGLGTPDHLILLSGDNPSGTVAQSVSYDVQVVDSAGNGVGGVFLEVLTVSGGGSAASPLVTTNSEGTAKISYTLGTTSGSNTLMIGRAENLLPGSPSTLLLHASGNPGPVSRISWASVPTTLTADETFSPSLRFLDTHGNVVHTASQSVTIAAKRGPICDIASTPGAFIIANESVNANAGLAQFSNAAYRKAEAIRLHATSGDFTDCSSEMNVTPGAPSSFVRVSVNPQLGISSIPLAAPLVAKLKDAFGNLVPNTAISWSIFGGSGSLTGTVPTSTDSNGFSSVQFTPTSPSTVRIALTSLPTVNIDFNVNVLPSGVYQWLRASVGVIDGGGGSNLTWSDPHTNRNATQLESMFKPTFVSSVLNGLPAFSFNGLTRFFALPAGYDTFASTYILHPGLSAFVVAKSSTLIKTAFFELGAISPQDQIVFGSDATGRLELINYIGGAPFSVTQSAPNIVPIGSFHIYEVVLDGFTTPTATLYRDGTPVGSSPFAIPTDLIRTQNFIGKRTGPGAGLFSGLIAEYLLFERGISTTERIQVEQYLGTKYGLF